ncbi:MAG TPA: FAD-dependent oxidoreductase [Ktedonobacterales bacterium]|nr:FAD-dependent oxidoreductase [Ktedonobacterales bacterium]
MAADIGKKYVIIGNGIAGTTCAQMLRKNDVACDIWLITNEPYPLYNRVSLPRYLQGLLPEQKVMIRDFAWHEQQRLTLVTETFVTRVDTDERVVYLDKGGPLRYDALLIATGGWANKLEVPGVQGTEFIFNFVTLDDTTEIIARALESKSAVTLGGSFIAYEMTEGLNVRGVHVTWLMRGPYWLRNILDEDGGRLIDAIATRHGVTVVHGDSIGSVVAEGGVPKRVVGTTGREYEADAVGVGLGLTLNHGFLANTQIQRRTGIVTNEFLETNVPGVYSAGDVAEFYDSVLGRHNVMGTWDNALAHGRVVAANMAGGREPYIDVPTYTSPLFDTNIAVMGTAESNNPELESFSHMAPGDKGNMDYRKFFFKQNRLVGAVFIGSPKGRKKMVELIRDGGSYATRAEREALFDVR